MKHDFSGIFHSFGQLVHNFTLRHATDFVVWRHILSSLKYVGLSDYEHDDFEFMWIALRPKQLPRPFTILLIAVVYCPPSYNADRKKNSLKF